MDPFTKWASSRKNVIKELIRLAEEMKEHAQNAKIASAVGTGTSIVSGVGATACFLAAPATLGASLIPAFVLTGVAAAGGATSIGSSITNYFIEKGYMNNVKAALEEDKAAFDELKRCVEEANSISAAEGIAITTSVGKKIPTGIGIGANIAGKIASKLTVSQKAATTLLRLGQTARFAGHALVFIALPIEIGLFINDAIALANGNVSAAADQVLKLAKDLEEEYNEIMAEAEKEPTTT